MRRVPPRRAEARNTFKEPAGGMWGILNEFVIRGDRRVGGWWKLSALLLLGGAGGSSEGSGGGGGIGDDSGGGAACGSGSCFIAWSHSHALRHFEESS